MDIKQLELQGKFMEGSFSVQYTVDITVID